MRALFALLVLGALAAACGSAKPPPPPRSTATATIAATAVDGARTVSDMLGRTVALPKTVDRVVPISPSAAGFAAALGLTIVGLPSDATPPAGSDAVAVGSTLSPDFNAIAALAPDLVIGDAAFDSGRLSDFDRFPYPVFVIKAAAYDDILAAFDALGHATGHESEAAAALDTIKARTAALVEKANAAGPPPSVLIVTGAGREVYGGGSETYVGSLIAKLGATNVLGVLPPGAPIAGFGNADLDRLADLDPAVVLVIPSGSGASGATNLADELRSSPAWANASALTANRIYELDAGQFLRNPGPGVAAALEHLYTLLYP